MSVIDVTTGKPFVFDNHNKDLRYIMKRIHESCVCNTCIVDICCSTKECNELNAQAEKWLEDMNLKIEKKEGKK